MEIKWTTKIYDHKDFWIGKLCHPTKLFFHSVLLKIQLIIFNVEPVELIRFLFIYFNWRQSFYVIHFKFIGLIIINLIQKTYVISLNLNIDPVFGTVESIKSLKEDSAARFVIIVFPLCRTLGRIGRQHSHPFQISAKKWTW